MAHESDMCTEQRLKQLQKDMESIEAGPQTPQTKIQRVPNYLRENPEFAKYYSPRLLSMGPIHHAKENLKLGEQYKLLWTAMYLKESNQDPVNLYQRIQYHIHELKDLYSEDAIGDHKDEDLVWMLLVDGCSLLQFIEKLDVRHPEKLRIKLDQQEHVVRDLQLLENQVPYKVLEFCWNKNEDLLASMFNLATGGLHKSDIVLFRGGSWSKILGVFEENIYNFFKYRGVKSKFFERAPAEPFLPQPQGQLRKPNHLLDYVRTVLLMSDHDTEEGQIQLDIDDHKHNQKITYLLWPTYKNIRDLKAAGIRVKRAETPFWSKISFTSKWFSGELKLPQFWVDDSTPYIYLNMIAYEMCPDFQNSYGISSYIAFFDSLIDDANDVMELRSAGVIQNLLGSDEEVAQLFNMIGNDLAAKGYNIISSDKMAYSKKCIQVKYEIEKHYRNKWKTWMAQAYNNHFSNPWSTIAFLVAVLAIMLTVVQTYLAINQHN